MTLLIRGARQLLTLRGRKGPRRGAAFRDLGIIPGGALLVRDGVVVEAGPARRVENLAAARPAEAVEAGGRVVMPSFVDCHTHMVFAGLALDRFEARLHGEGVDSQDVPAEAAVRPVHTTSRLTHRAALRLNRMVRHGSTTIGVKSGYGAGEAEETKILRAARALRTGPADVVPSLLAGKVVRGPMDYLCDELLPGLARRRLIRMADLVCDPARYTTTDMRRYLRAARALRLGVSLHAGQCSIAEAVRLGDEEGAWSVTPMEGCPESAVAALAESQVVATLLPGPAFHRGGCGLPPARALIDRGAAVALATGFSPDVSPTFSMQMAISLACSQMRMTPAEAIVAATINGAHALGLGNRTGSLEPGKAADLLLLNVSDYREAPFVFGANHVHRVYRRGEPVYDEERD